MREVIITSILQGFDQKNHFFQGRSWFKFNNLGLVLGIASKFYTSVAKGLKLKVRKFLNRVKRLTQLINMSKRWSGVINRISVTLVR